MTRSEELFRLAVEAAQLDAYRVDLKAGSLEFLGQPRAGRHLAQRMTLPEFQAHVHAADRDGLERAVRAAAGTPDGTYEVEFRLVSPDGGVRWMRAVGRLSLGVDGAPDEHLGVMRDITTERAAQEELRARENWFRALIENATELITVLDPTGRIIYKSPSSHATLGYDPDALLGRNALEFIHPDDVDAVRRVLDLTLRQPDRSLQAEFRFRAADDSWHILSGELVNLLHHPDVRGIIVNSRDRTEERALERDLQQSRRLEAIGQLAGGIAHDFNNILTAIRGGAHFALEQLEPGHPARTDLEDVLAGVDRATLLTNQLLTFSRRQPARMSVHDLNQLLQSLESMLRRLIGEDIRLSVQTSPRPSSVRIDPSQFEQVVINLVVNARDAMPRGGSIDVHVDHMTIDREFARRFDYDVKLGNYVRLCVADTGTGIPPDVREHIFEPFFTTKEAGRGTGLGLATVYGIVKQANGYIWLDADRPRGTAFEILLPENAESVHAAAAQADPTQPSDRFLDGLRILLCEDEPAVRAVARRFLEGAGCLVSEAADGRAALEVAADSRLPIDLLITDVVMPGMSGRELATEIQSLHPETRILLISGYPEGEIARRGVLITDAPYLHKPFDRSELLDAVRRAVEPRVS